MADSKISALSAITTPATTDEMVLASGGATKKITVANFAKLSPGYELVYAQITSPVTVSATSSGTAGDVITCGATTFDGTAVYMEFFAPRIDTGSGGQVHLMLQEGATILGYIGGIVSGSGVDSVSVTCRYKFTPSAASHTYKVTAFRTTANGTIQAGPAGATPDYTPAYLRFVKA